MGDPETPTHKRQRLFLATDPDLTPRPDPTRASSVSSSNASGRSRSSSPLKRQFLELRLDASGIETRALTVDGLMAIPNPEAACLLRIIRRISAYRGFLPDRLRDEILQNHNIKGSDLDDWDSAFKDSSAFDDLPGRIPSPGEIRLINEWTIECIEFKHEEAGWNDEVHFPLLKAIFREPGEKNGGLFNITTCHTARPHKAWLPKSIGSKMVDFCVYADTAFKDDVSLETHEAFCRSTLTKSVNHTEFHRLQIRPIVLSIETKAGSHNLDEAELQVGVWHASQWAFLRSSLISLKRASMTGPPTQQELEQADQVLATLQFIPAVIVQGSRWLFVLSTRQGQKTVLWKEWQFGSTATVMETYQVVAGLRQLTAWADKVYLPWFQKEILAYYERSIK
ncbi:hypothetical protein FOPG_18379 [Fusarium oxysporum f. sp. conglutinans race 2 54008]|uniref:PD-(D/E)XK nuclease-like domain-containing protein n=1 Tax=Fusarium oxysporum f. sp. conglutinans race 2 54008 TaxID=1089457 RepID=X0GP70_FUSOX|nr:hypothetical protein FOPG_18379 [Fusarium oxysporum f. sp. conglutinans race 2 54008]